MLYDQTPTDRIFLVTKSFLHHEMERGCKLSGVKKIRIHDLRHSHISHLIDLGFSAVVIADRVGHESIDITYRYSHLFPSKQVAMADRLDAVNASFEDCEEQDDDADIMQAEETAPMIDMDAAAERGINGVRWNIVNEDYLKWECDRKFEFIVGNPPYITYQELDEENRDYVRKKFSTCEKGKFDYCYAFIERSVDSLSDDGKMSYLIPSSIFKTVFGQKLRSYIKPYLQEIYDYTQDKMFDDALVKSAIIIINKSITNNEMIYYDMANEDKIYINTENLTNKWFFTKNNIPGTRRFGDYFQVAHVVATLLNEAICVKRGKLSRYK